jgi:(p)ppGpp synthase/HD superfamily hydrolase
MNIKAISEGVELVARARRYATKKHEGQEYGNGVPYTTHLEDVESILIEFNHISSILRAAAWLHDVLEDVLTRQEQREQFKLDFPGYLNQIIEAVTAEPGKNRKERNIKTYPKIAALELAIVVKLADRIANGRAAKRKPDTKFYEMYKQEYPEFRAALYASNIDTMPMWWELDRLFEYQGV